MKNLSPLLISRDSRICVELLKTISGQIHRGDNICFKRLICSFVNLARIKSVSGSVARCELRYSRFDDVRTSFIIQFAIVSISFLIFQFLKSDNRPDLIVVVIKWQFNVCVFLTLVIVTALIYIHSI